MNTYIILENRYFGGIESVPDDTQGIRPGTTRTAPPEIPEGKYAYWVGTGWIIVDEPPIEKNPLENVNSDLVEINENIAEIYR